MKCFNREYWCNSRTVSAAVNLVVITAGNTTFLKEGKVAVRGSQKTCLDIFTHAFGRKAKSYDEKNKLYYAHR